MVSSSISCRTTGRVCGYRRSLIDRASFSNQAKVNAKGVLSEVSVSQASREFARRDRGQAGDGPSGREGHGRGAGEYTAKAVFWVSVRFTLAAEAGRP